MAEEVRNRGHWSIQWPALFLLQAPTIWKTDWQAGSYIYKWLDRQTDGQTASQTVRRRWTERDRQGQTPERDKHTCVLRHHSSRVALPTGQPSGHSREGQQPPNPDPEWMRGLVLFNHDLDHVLWNKREPPFNLSAAPGGETQDAEVRPSIKARSHGPIDIDIKNKYRLVDGYAALSYRAYSLCLLRNMLGFVIWPPYLWYA